MTAPGSTSRGGDLLVASLEREIHNFLRVKRRYPVLKATVEEVRALGLRRGLERLRNDAFVQFFWDAVAMLVIDMYSVRQSMIKKEGVFDFLRRTPERLQIPEPKYRRDTLERIDAPALRELMRSFVADGRPATEDFVNSLCAAFIRDTDRIDDDRNKVRAHPFERNTKEPARFLIPLPDLESEIKTMWSYLHTLYLFVTIGHFDDGLVFQTGTEGAARNFADLMVHGSIHSAVHYYGGGVARATGEGPIAHSYNRAREAVLMRDTDGSET